jgi:hypothetical protein
MRRPSLRSVLVITALMVPAYACGLFIDSDKLISGPFDDAGNGTTDGPPGTTGDGKVIDPNCKPTGAEVCDDGIDNDCNGDIDCADEACTAGFQCADRPPEGWTPIALARTSRPNCPQRFTKQTDLRIVEGADGAAVCRCECDGACNGNITLESGGDNTCTTSNQTFDGDTGGACTNKAYDQGAFAKVTPPSSTACGARNVLSNGATNGRSCDAPTKVGGGCANNQVCVARSPGFESCVAKAGAPTMCPSGFANPRRAGTTINEQRACNGCACAVNGACTSEIEIWTQPNCMGGADSTIKSQDNSNCSATKAVNNVKAYKSKTSGGCAVTTQSAPSGSIAFTAGEETICCK